MVVKTVLDVTDGHLFWYYASSIGGLIAFILLSLLLIHITYNYLKLFHVSVHSKLVQIRQTALSATNLAIIDNPNEDQELTSPNQDDDDIDTNNHRIHPFHKHKSYDSYKDSNKPYTSNLKLTPASSSFNNLQRPRLGPPRHHHHKSRSFTQREKQSTNKIIYKLMIGYLISGIIAAIIFGFLRSNILWMNIYHKSDIYTSWYCGFGYFGGYIMRAFEKTFLYYLLLYRIQIVFKESAYNSLSPKLYKFLTFAWIPCVTIAVALFVSGKVFILWHDEEGKNKIVWLLHYHPATGALFCGGDKLGIFLIIILVFITLSDLMFFASLLAIFMKNLCSLETALMQQYNDEARTMREINLMIQIKSEADCEELASISPSLPSPGSDNDLSIVYRRTNSPPPPQYKHTMEKYKNNNGDTNHYKNGSNGTNHYKNRSSLDSRMSFKDIISEYDKTESSAKKESIERIIILHKLAKKQFILACITIVSSQIYWLASFVSTKLSLLASWDILINSICVWLMFGCSRKYWKFCCKYFCCFICYCQLNKIDKIIESERLKQEERNYSNQFKKQYQGKYMIPQRSDNIDQNNHLDVDDDNIAEDDDNMDDIMAADIMENNMEDNTDKQHVHSPSMPSMHSPQTYSTPIHSSPTHLSPLHSSPTNPPRSSALSLGLKMKMAEEDEDSESVTCEGRLGDDLAEGLESLAPNSTRL